MALDLRFRVVGELAKRPSFRFTGTAALILLGVAGLIVFLGVFRVWDPGSTQRAWSHLGVPAMSRSFADLRSVLAAVDCSRRGVNVYLDDPCDPWDRAFNYPPAWLLLAKTPIGTWAVDWIGCAMALALVAGVIALLGRIPVRESWVAAAAVFSPMNLLLVERGNTDIVCWLLVLVAVFLTGSRGRIRSMTGSLLLGLAVLLKLYPLFLALTRAVREPVTRALQRYLPLAVAIAAALVSARKFGAILGNSDFGGGLSYGYETFLYAYFEPDAFSKFLSRVLAVFVLAASCGLGLSRVRLVEVGDDRDSTFYLAGASIYAGTFLLGDNWGYRTVFLLFCIPHLCARLATQDPATRKSALLMIVSILGLQWSMGLTVSGLLDVVAPGAWFASLVLGWVLFVLFTAQLTRALFERGAALLRFSAPLAAAPKVYERGAGAGRDAL